MNTVAIGTRHLGEGQPVFIAVETGVTCNGDVDTALGVVDAAVAAGADAVKFMIIGCDQFMSDRSVTYEYEWAGGHNAENMYEMFKGLEFTRNEWTRIRDHCHKRGILFYATVDYLEGVDLAQQLDMPAIKLSSWDTGNLPLIERCAKTGLPLQIDTGPTTVGEIDSMINCIHAAGNSDVILVHCSHAADAAGLNLRSIPYMRDVFGVPVGFSADSRDAVPDIEAVALGACLIEKRMTLDKSYKGHHHIKALEPDEFKEYVATIRKAEQSLGAYCVRPSAADLQQKKMYYVSVVAERDMAAGDVITADMLACKRPGTGLPPSRLGMIVGRRAKRDIKRNELISWADV